MVGAPVMSNALAQGAPPAAEPGKETPKKVDEMAEAASKLVGMAGQPECVWFGRRIVSLMFRDDLDTAARHREIFERFGCPTGQIQAAFRCMARNGELDAKAPDALSNRAHACWVNPDWTPPQPPAAEPAEPAAPAP